MRKVRKTTINLVCGILIGMFISGVSEKVSGPKTPTTETTPKTVATSVTLPSSEPLEELGQIAPGLQILEMPSPLNLNGLHPYQTYINGQPVAIPYAVIGELLKEHDHLIANDENVNLHNMNLKRVD
jgi:hypothetical protein